MIDVVPGDYEFVSGTLNIAPGSTSGTVSVPITGDPLVEPNETFFVNLSMPANALVADGQGLGTILDLESSRPFT